MTCDVSRLDEMEDDEEILDFLKELDDELGRRYTALHAEWERNVLFYLGKQWLRRKSGTYDGYDILEEEDGHYRPVTNHVARACDLKRSQVLGKIVRPKVEPRSTQRSDIASARLSTLALSALNEIDDDDALNELAFLHGEVFGTCWRADYKKACVGEYLEEPVMETVTEKKMVCDDCQTEQEYQEPQEGPGVGGTGAEEPPAMVCPQCAGAMRLDERETEQQKTGEDGEPLMDRIPTYRPASVVIDPFRMRVNACAVEKDIRYLDEGSVQPVSWIKTAYAVQAEGFKGHEAAEKVVKAKSLPRGLKISEEFKNSVTFSHSSIDKDVSVGAEVENSDETTILHKTYFHPSDKYPRGRLIIWTPDVILYDGYPDVPNNARVKKWYPHNIFIYRRHPLRLEGIAYMEDLIPLNKKYNSFTAMIMEHMDKTADPDRIEFDNVTMNNDDQSSGRLIIKPVPNLPNGGAPTYLQHPQMASEVYNMLPATMAEFEKMGNITEIMQGMRPAGVDTYRGLQLLRDSADSSEKELYARWHAFVRKCAKLKLALLQECLVQQDEELIEMMNSIRKNENYGVEEIKTFMGEDLRDNINVVVEEVDYMSQTTAAQTDRVADLLKSMILTPEDLQDPVVKIQLMRRLGMSQMPMSDKADIEKAERVIEFIEAGNIQQAMGILSLRDNKSLQLRVWSEWMKTSRYESLPQQIKQMGEIVVRRVETELLQTQQAQQGGMGMQQPPQMGAGPTGPGAPPEGDMKQPPAPMQ